MLSFHSIHCHGDTFLIWLSPVRFWRGKIINAGEFESQTENKKTLS